MGRGAGEQVVGEPEVSQVLADELVVPVGVWFQIEAYYRNAPDPTGALAVWFDLAMGPTIWSNNTPAQFTMDGKLGVGWRF